ncbi:MAG: DoxX family membrane protein [Bacteroidales bacterium]|nr:DoxX family membrane protein [Bacteroidales bacterium]
MNHKRVHSYTGWQIFGLTLLRVLIGWHFLYEGLIKIYTPEWSAGPYLSGALGPFAPLFKNIARNEVILSAVDFLNAWGLVLIGLSLFIGFLTKPAKLFGILLLLFYYLAYPPFSGLVVDTWVEGNYWIVNKNLIEMAALFVLYLFPTSQITGLARFFSGEKGSIPEG